MSISEDVKYLRRWAAAHDERHTTEGDRLNLILEAQQKHDTNHHGPKSRVKLGAVLTLLSAMVMLTGELLRRFAL